LNDLSNRLPQGAGPVQFLSGFGDTAALMLTVASPRTDDVEIGVRAEGLRNTLTKLRSLQKNKTAEPRVAPAYCVPQSGSPDLAQQGFAHFAREAERDGIFRNIEFFGESGCVGLDATSSLSDQEIRSYADAYIRNRVYASELHPDAWGPLVIRNPNETEKQ